MPDENAPKEFPNARVIAEDAKTELVRRLSPKEPEPPTITVERGRVPLDPSVDVFHVVLQTKDGVWEESFGSEIETYAFLRGVEAGSYMLGATNVSAPEIPQEPTNVFSFESTREDTSNESTREDTSNFDEIPF